MKNILFLFCFLIGTGKKKYTESKVDIVLFSPYIRKQILTKNCLFLPLLLAVLNSSTENLKSKLFKLKQCENSELGNCKGDIGFQKLMYLTLHILSNLTLQREG